MNTRYQKYQATYKAYREKNKIQINILRSRWTDKKRFSGKREEILKRDDFKCTQCGMTNEEHKLEFKRSITIDHIDGNGIYSKTPNNDSYNLITLCLPCHGRKDRMRYLKSILK